MPEEASFACPFIGTDITIHRGGEILCGRVHGLTADGALEVLTLEGQLRTAELGEIFESSNH